MDEVLAEVVVPALRDLGFVGSLPHFRRRRTEQMDLVMFQFFSSGGKFVVELGHCPPDGLVTGAGKRIPPDKVRVYVVADRARLGKTPLGYGDHCFKFDRPNHEPPLSTRPRRIRKQCVQAANEVVRLLDQAEGWWRGEETAV